MKLNIEKTFNLEFFQKYLGKDFQFRQGQLQIIHFLYNSYLEDPLGSVILELPTGAGKSVIGFCFSLMMNYENKRGYIVTSDLSLQKQYENDLIKYRLLWGSIKGVDNYKCDVNDMVFSLGECRLRRLSYEKAKELPCYSSCGYFSNRDRAMMSDTSILNYSFWLLQMNYVKEKMEDRAPFQCREFTIFDECHKIEDIVQNHFSPFISERDIDKLKKLDQFLRERPLLKTRVDYTLFNTLFTELCHKTENQYNNLTKIESLLVNILMWGNTWKDEIQSSYIDKIIPKDISSIFSILEWVKDLHCKVEDYNKIIKEFPESIVKSYDKKNNSIKFYTTEESYIIKKYLLDQAGFKIFMSATIGEGNKFGQLLGLKNFKFIRSKSDFDFSKSPIHIFSKYKLSYKEKEQSFPKMLELLDRILDRHQNQRGLIHTGSYDISNKIMMSSRNSDRFLFYQNSKEKEESLERHNVLSDSVLIGPSHIEGINMIDDLSRFQIIFKVPYPSLMDELTKARMNKNSTWYSWKTSISFLQELGRSNRHKDDWCITYILDACILDLISRENFPKWLSDRFNYI